MRPPWLQMRHSDFGATEPLTLFDIADVPASPDKLATPDKQGSLSLFTSEEA